MKPARNPLSGALDASHERTTVKAGEESGKPVAGEPPRDRTLVLAIGNQTAGDDGFGPAVLEALSRTDLPADVEIADGGILGIDLLSRIEDFERLILVDAIRVPADGASHEVRERGLELETGRSGYWVERQDPVPGDVVVFRLGEVDLDDPDPRFSLHDLSFGGCLKLARLLGLPLPEIRVVGFVLASVSSLEGFCLGPEAAAAVPKAVLAIHGLLDTSARLD